jgi:hypothetical protein
VLEFSVFIVLLTQELEFMELSGFCVIKTQLKKDILELSGAGFEKKQRWCIDAGDLIITAAGELRDASSTALRPHSHSPYQNHLT